MHKQTIVKIIVGLVGLILTAAIFVAFFDRLQIEGTSFGMDWKSLYQGIENGSLQYGTGFYNPPWSIIYVLPLGLLSFRQSWAVLTLVTLAVLLISVPRTPKKSFYVGIALVSLAYPTLRTIIDGNFELFVIGGALLIIYAVTNRLPVAMIAGVLLITSKIQESWYLLGLLPIFLLKRWNVKEVINGAVGLFIIVFSFLVWKGYEWFQALFSLVQRGSIMDITLLTTCSRFEIPNYLAIGIWLLFFFHNNDSNI